MSIRQYPREGVDSVRYLTQVASATLADLTTDAAVVLSNSADERVAFRIDLRAGTAIELGRAVAAALHPDGDRVLVTAADYRGNLQVYAVRPDSEERAQLTFLAQGVGTRLSVTRDGRFALADLADQGAPALVLISLDHASVATSGAP